MTLQARLIILASMLAMAAGSAWYGAYRYYKPAPEVITPAAEIRQQDGSLVPKRDSTVKVTRRHNVPGKILRDVSLTVQPTQKECDPVTVDLTLYEDGKGGKRVVASSPDGQVIDGIDVPATDLAGAIEAKRNRVYAAYNPSGYAIAYSRTYGPLSVGVMATKEKGRDVRPWVIVGIDF